MEIFGLVIILLVIAIPVGLFFAPLFIWHYTAESARILQCIEKKLDSMSYQDKHEGKESTEAKAKPQKEEPSSSRWQCPRCTGWYDVGKTRLPNGGLKCPTCGVEAEIEGDET